MRKNCQLRIDRCKLRELPSICNSQFSIGNLQSLLLAKEPRDLWHDLPHRPAAVREDLLDKRPELAERPVIFDDLEQRVVTEASCPRRSRAYPASALAATLGANLAVFVRQR